MTSPSTGGQPRLVRWDPSAQAPFPSTPSNNDYVVQSSLHHHPSTNNNHPNKEGEENRTLSFIDDGSTPRQHRYILNDVIGRLQRAIVVGGEFSTVERREEYPPPPPPSSVFSSPVRDRGGGGESTTTSPTDSAVSLLAQQLESVARREIALLESDTRIDLIIMFMRTMQRRQTIANHAQRLALENLECTARRRLEDMQSQCVALTEKELNRTLVSLRESYHAQNVQYWVHQEEKNRSALEVQWLTEFYELHTFAAKETDRILNPLGRAIFEAERERRQRIEHEQTKVFCHTLQSALATRSSMLFSLGTLAARQHQMLKKQSHLSIATTNNTVESPLSPTQQQAAPTMETVGSMLSLSACYDPVVPAIGPGSEYPSAFGWMFKSTGVYTSWQKRYFTFVNGVLKFSTTEEGVANGDACTLIHIQHVARVEYDVYGDSSQCVRPPPASKFHQYGFYVDTSQPDTSAKKNAASSRDNSQSLKKRFRFCCLTKQELTTWMSVLRRSVDLCYVKGVCGVGGGGSGAPIPAWFEGEKAPPYRTRVMLEEAYGPTSPRGSPKGLGGAPAFNVPYRPTSPMSNR
eukprot:PhF_6_TR43363/c0_g1_i3/m.66460